MKIFQFFIFFFLRQKVKSTTKIYQNFSFFPINWILFILIVYLKVRISRKNVNRRWWITQQLLAMSGSKNQYCGDLIILLFSYYNSIQARIQSLSHIIRRLSANFAIIFRNFLLSSEPHNLSAIFWPTKSLLFDCLTEETHKNKRKWVKRL